MTGNKDKVRSLILATLMVVSVFAGTLAFAGAASATVNGLNTANTSATDVSTDEGLTKQRVRLNLSTSDGSADDVTLSYSGTPFANNNAEIVSAELVSTGSGATAANATKNGSSSVTIHNFDGASGASSHSVLVEVTLDTTDASAASNGQITVTSANGSITSGNTVDFNFADLNAANAFAEDSSTFWRGQGVYFEGNNSQTYQIRSVDDDGGVGTLVTEFQTNSNGVAIINTDQSTIENGQGYVITTTNRDIVVTNELGVQKGVDADQTNASDYSWEVQKQTLSAEFNDNEVSNTGENTDTTVDFSSNRGSYDVTISADGLTSSDLRNIFSGENIVSWNDDQETVTVSGVSASGELDADFTDVDADDYQFTFEGADTSASSTANVTVTENEGSMSLAGTVTEQRGDVATINANFDGADDGYVQIGGSDVGYNVTVAVSDGGDGKVGLKMNTYLAGRDTANESDVFSLTDSSQDDDDSIKGVYAHSSDLSSPLEAGTYDVAVGTEAQNVSTGTSAHYWIQNEDDLGTLDLQERGTQGVQVWTAPSDADYDDQKELLQQVNQTNDIAKGDLAVVQLKASGIYGQLSGTDQEIKQALYNESNGFMLTIEEANPGANQEATKLAMNSNTVQNVFQDDANNSLYVVVDTGINGDAVNGGNFEWQADEDYTASWTINQNNPMVDADEDTAGIEKETANQDFTLTELDAEFNNLNSNDELQLASSKNAQVSGSTTLAPGSEVTIRVRSSGSGSSFLKSVEATVTANRTFSTTIDMSDVDVGANFTALVRKNDGGQTLTEVDGTVVEQVQTETPSETTETGTPSETTSTPSETTASGGETTTADTTTTQSGGNGGTTTETTQTNTPGFGVIVALVALVAAALLAVRREN